MRRLVWILAPFLLVLGLIGPAGAAGADPAESERSEVSFARANECNGEPFTMQGTTHVVTKQQEDGSSIQHTTMHAHGVSPEGNEYVVNQTRVTRTTSHDSSFIMHFQVISMGSEPNFVLMVRFDSDKEPTVEVDCRA